LAGAFFTAAFFTTVLRTVAFLATATLPPVSMDLHGADAS
jgi:hypothetical protein